MNNRERILSDSIELFNNNGTVAVTTNHISKHLRISPGNLYFHFSNKEEIVRELFQGMCREIYEAWDPALDLAPMPFLERSFEVFWRYRFFHREMYHLRRRDPELSKAWKKHLKRCERLMILNYGQWVKKGYFKPITDKVELRLLSDTVMLSSSAYLGFFESPEKPASRKVLRDGIEHVARLLWRYFSDSYRREVAGTLSN